MDFLYFDPTFRVLICTRCQYALVQSSIASHLGSLHKEEVAQAEIKRCVEFWKVQPIQSAKAIQQLDIAIDTPPIQNLALLHNGIVCRLCTERSFVCGRKTTRQMREHLKTVHGWQSGCKGGRPPTG